MTLKVNRSALAHWLLEWEEKRRELDLLEKNIESLMLHLGESVTVGYTYARYTKGRTTTDYEAAVKDVPGWENTVRDFQETEIDWRAIATENIDQDVLGELDMERYAVVTKTDWTGLAKQLNADLKPHQTTGEATVKLSLTGGY